MSYNITGWKVRTINLTLPLTFDFRQWLHMQPNRDEKGYENVGKRWCLEDEESKLLVDFASQTWKLVCSGPTLSGVIVNGDSLALTDFEGWTGDGSGHLYSDILLSLFKQFNGTLNALVIWEGGDSIYCLNIHDGIVGEVEES